MVGFLRLRKRTSELSLLLNTFVKGGITVRHYEGQNRWVQPDLSIPECHLYIDNYTYVGFTAQGEQFTDTTHIEPIPRERSQLYYTGVGVELGKPLSLPASIDRLITTFFELSGTYQELFMRSAFWYYQATHSRSYSVSWLHYIQAIDTLVPRETGATQCEKCHQKSGKSLTQRFVEFLDTVVPENSVDNGDSKQIEKARRALCKRRGEIVHGWDLLNFDRHDLYDFKPQTNNDQRSLAYASQLSRHALINWLVRQAK
jgi:hypothetical protein